MIRMLGVRIVEMASNLVRRKAQMRQCKVLGTHECQAQEFVSSGPKQNCPCQFRWQCPFNGVEQ